MPESKARAAIAAALVAVALLAFVPRTIGGLKRPRGPEPRDGWYSIDPDGLYHTRRVERAFAEGLPIAGTDPYLDFPRGARIPWPPYYDTILYFVLAPFAPGEAEARRPFLERAVATLPIAFGVIAALCAAGAAWCLSRTTGGPWQRAGVAAFAGVYAACGWGAINYSRIGSGDHHAWIEMLQALSLLAACLAFGARSLRSTGLGLAWGALCGLLAGTMLGSWVASLGYVVLMQAVLGWLLVRRAREDLPGVASFGLAYHVVALAVLAPAVLASPWKDEFPWMVVNLSWFHLAWLGLGALVFVPPLSAGRGALRAGTAAARAYPFAVALVLAALAWLAWLLDTPVARGIEAGLAWVSRADAFMDSVKESAPLIGPRAVPGELFIALGFGVLIAPLAWGAAAWRSFRHRADELLPWAVVLPVLLALALVQKRFSDAAVLPLAVLLAWGGARWLARVPAWSALPVSLALALLGQIESLRRAGPRLLAPIEAGLGGPADAFLGERTAIEWLRANSPASGGFSVLSHWDRGHVIEWAADRPTVATNFGSYVGLESYRDPARFFLAEDPELARGILAERESRYVLVPATLARNVSSMARIAGLAESLFVAPGPGGNPVPTALFQRTLLLHLLRDGRGVAGQDGSLSFLRLVHAATSVNEQFRDPATGKARPAAFVWEHVPGAAVEWRGSPSEEFAVEIDVAYAAAGHGLRWQGSARADSSGVARLRVPYATDRDNGDGRVRRAEWAAAGRRGALAIPEKAVLSGATISLP